MKTEISKEEKIDGYDKWDLESCVDCLIRAEEIRTDAKKMKALKPFLDKKLKSMKTTIDSLDGLREFVKNKQEKDLESDDYE